MKNFFLILLCITGAVMAQNTEEDMDAMFLENSEEKAESRWDIFGYYESENFFSIAKPLGGKRPAESDIVKLESRLRINTKYGGNFIFGKASLDAYFYPSDFDGLSPQKNGTVDAYEAYVAAGEKLQFKAGKQVFNWGSADAFRIVNYADQRDLREMFMKEEDEKYRGVFALDIKYLFSDFSIETFILPISERPILPDEKSFWAIAPQTDSVPVTVDLKDEKKALFKNGSYGVRGGGTFGFLDIYLSYFYGQNNSIVLYPETTIEISTQTPQSIVLKPDFSKVNKTGVDFAFSVEKLAVRGEAVFTRDHRALLKDTQETEVIEQVGTNLIVRQKTESVPYLSYTIGADYNVWGDYGRFLAEYASSAFLRNSGKYEEEFFNNFLLLSLEDHFFDNYLEIKAMSILRLANDVGWIPGFNLTYNFQNGFTVTAGALLIYGYDDNMLSMYDNHDIAYFRAKMAF
ncbi:MAG: hypothetical protein OEZ13_12370 [Spirochaetia bacterium]|nr:hypothetical protein [Spirochaetia bacterium]